MISKRIMVEFADPRIKAVGHVWDIGEAAEHAKVNLYARHKIYLSSSPIEEGHNLFLEISIPDEFGENFRPGNYLRGISKYLLDNFNGFYKKYLIGKRLLYYIDEDDM